MTEIPGPVKYGSGYLNSRDIKRPEDEDYEETDDDEDGTRETDDRSNKVENRPNKWTVSSSGSNSVVGSSSRDLQGKVGASEEDQNQVNLLSSSHSPTWSIVGKVLVFSMFLMYCMDLF